MPAAVVDTRTPTSTVSTQLTATSADWPTARGAVNAQKSRAISRVTRTGTRSLLAVARFTRVDTARAENTRATTVVAAQHAPTPTGPMPRPTAMATTIGSAVARPTRSIRVWGIMVLNPRVPDTSTECRQANGRNRAIAWS